VPAAAIEAVGANISQTWHRFRRDPTDVDRRALHANLARVALPISASLDTTLTAGELLQLRPGDILSLGAPVHEPLNVRVRGAMKFKGRLAAQGQRAQLRIDRAAGRLAQEA
jgi:flagellar motor switch protein FliM